MERDDRKNLELEPISIRDYLSFTSQADVPEKPLSQNEGEREKQRQQASRFMCGIMDECTHLSNFSVPVSKIFKFFS